MAVSDMLFFAGGAVEVGALDLLLGADNAVLIALACRPLPVKLRKRVLLIGLVGAIGLRFGLVVLTSSLLFVPGLRVGAAVFLMSISIGMLIESNDSRVESISDPADVLRPRAATARLWQSAAIVVAADFVMSLDNIVALVSVSQGSVTLLILGLLMSVPALMYGSFVATNIFDKSPALVTAGAVFLGWIAGQMAASDVLTSAWILQQAPALTVVLPALCACYVYIAGRRPPPRSGLS
jgi:YjbE family integral membrane protein